jgi:cytochrome c-type biogenesis protein CcmH
VRRVATTLAAVLALGALGPAITSAAAAAATTPKANLTDVENDVMCPSCREPLAVAQSPQAYAERNFIRGLIAQGLTKAQIERQLVAQYGPSVLGKPPAHGFNLTVYVLPPALVLLGLGILAITLPRWRRRTRAATSQEPGAPAPAPSAADAERLDEDLATFRG